VTGLRELRLQRGLSLEAVAYMAGDEIDIATISRVERGEVRPRRDTVVKLARAFGISINRMVRLLSEDVADRGDQDERAPAQRS
jgi:transcriptional regulator with XRE-family HTH domain